ncbi:17175_t:CDS:2, partial [Cetraspora pellucida]
LKSPLRPIEANSLVEVELQEINVTDRKRKRNSKYTGVKKKRGNSESSLANDDDINDSYFCSYSSKNAISQREDNVSNALSNALSPRSSNALFSKSSNALSPRSQLPEDYYDQQMLMPKVGLSLLSDLELCLYLVQHPNLINLAQSMLKADGQKSVMTLGKVDKFGALQEKCYIDVTDVQKTFRNQHDNVDKFNDFIRTAFDLFVQENLLDKDVINEFKELNHMTVDMNIFTANGKEYLQQLDLQALL